MLGKLFKYEIRSTARMFLLLYPALIIMALLNKLLFTVLDDVKFLDIPRVLMMMIYVFLVIAVFAITIIITIQRFYKNLLGEEGYLMFTLPVKPVMHIITKLVVSVMWFFGSVVVSLLSVFIMLPDYKWIKEVPELLSKISRSFRSEFDASFGLFITGMIICGIIGVIFFIIQVYSAISIGHLANKNRLVVAFGAYIGQYTVIQTITMIIIGIIGINVTDSMSATITGFSEGAFVFNGGAFLFSSIIMLVMSTALFFTTKLILSKKLNLE